MLYLAQINQNNYSSQIGLELLAKQVNQTEWVAIEPISLTITQNDFIEYESFVLIELEENNRVSDIKAAKNFILNILAQPKIIPSNHQQLLEIESWQQQLTAKSLDLKREKLEIESRREELQELERTLQQERENLAQEKAVLQQKRTEIELRILELRNLDNPL